MGDIENMERQLAELYRDKELLDANFPGKSAQEIVTLVRSVDDELNRLIQERFDALESDRARLAAAFPGLTIDEVIELARQGAKTSRVTPPDPTDQASSLEAQLIELYDEKRQIAEQWPGLEIEEVVAEIKAKIERLERLCSDAA